MNTYISASAWPSHLLCPSLKHKKGVTFHKNKARPHHLLCIVRTFLLELCFWILTVTVPDPGLNGNLASGPFGFLIEYPCSSGYVCVCVCVCVCISLALCVSLCVFVYLSGFLRAHACVCVYAFVFRAATSVCVCVCVCVCVSVCVCV